MSYKLKKMILNDFKEPTLHIYNTYKNKILDRIIKYGTEITQ